MGEESAGKFMSQIPLSTNIINRRIHDKAEDLNVQLLKTTKGKLFGLEIDIFDKLYRFDKLNNLNISLQRNDV